MKPTNNQPLPLHMALPCLANSGAIVLIKAAPASMSTLAMQIAYELNVSKLQGLFSYRLSSRLNSAFVTEFSQPSYDIKYTDKDASCSLLNMVAECSLTKKDQTLICLDPIFSDDAIIEEARIGVNRIGYKLTQIYISSNQQTNVLSYGSIQLLENCAEYVYSLESNSKPDILELRVTKNGGVPIPSQPFMITDLGANTISPFCPYEVM